MKRNTFAAGRDVVMFPLKHGNAVKTKVNFRFSDLFAGAWAESPTTAAILGGLIALIQPAPTNDFASALLWLGFAAEQVLGILPAVWLIAVAADAEQAKAVNLDVKRYGIARCYGAQFAAELTTLIGRGAVSPPLMPDLAHRLVSHPPECAVFKEEALANAIDCVLRDELGKIVHVRPRDAYWRQRYTIKANGSLSAATMRHPWVTRPQVAGRAHKHEWLEAQQEFEWDCPPVVYATHSLKLEHGKTRHLYACDGVSWV